MEIQPIEELLAQAGNSIYRLSRIASLRALELADGKPPLIKKPHSDRLTTLAIEEMRQKKVVWKPVPDKIAPPKSEKPKEQEAAKSDQEGD